MSQQSSNFLRYIHNFRGLAILLIVVGHVAGLLTFENRPRLNTIIQILIANGSVYFVFIAGFLFQFLSKKYQYGSYLKKKFKNVILPYLLISIPAIALCVWKGQPYYPATGFASAFANWSVFQQIAVLYLTGAHFFHFWFMPMIILFYFFAPLFIWIDRQPKFYSILPILLILSVLVPRAEDDSLVLQNFVHFLSIYTLGMFCSHYREKMLDYIQKHWLFLTIVVVALIALEIYMRITATPVISVLYTNTLAKAILSLLIMYCLWRFDATFSSRFHAVMNGLANLSFGIYFLHGYFVYIYAFGLSYSGLKSWMGSGEVLLLATVFLLVILCTIATLLVTQKLFGKNSRYIIGC